MDKGLPPSGVGQNQGAKYTTVSAILMSLSVIIVACRFIARVVGSKNFGWDDWTMLAASCLTVVYFGVGPVGTRAGFGRHIYDLDIAQIIRVGKATFVSQLLSFLIICVVKISVALFLLRIGGLRRWLRMSLFVTIALLVSSTSATIIVLLVQCRPIGGLWDPMVKQTANCLSPAALTDVTYCSIAISILTDFLCTALPFQIIGDLQMNRRTKNSVLAVLSMGSLAMICGIVRMTLVKSLVSSKDPTWNYGTLASWTFAEFSVGIIAGSIPPCRVLVLQILYRFGGKAPSNENTDKAPSSRSGLSFPLKSLSRTTNTSSRSQSNAEAPEDSQKRYIPAKLWNREATRAASQDSGREYILPLHSVVKPNLDIGS
ncbi:hypothetical protein BDR22DRAFT_971869 [Usnea florida]